MQSNSTLPAHPAKVVSSFQSFVPDFVSYHIFHPSSQTHTVFSTLPCHPPFNPTLLSPHTTLTQPRPQSVFQHFSNSHSALNFLYCLFHCPGSLNPSLHFGKMKMIGALLGQKWNIDRPIWVDPTLAFLLVNVLDFAVQRNFLPDVKDLKDSCLFFRWCRNGDQLEKWGTGKRRTWCIGKGAVWPTL